LESFVLGTNIGEHLKDIRKELNISQLDITRGKIGKGVISLIECNKMSLKVDNAYRISKNINYVLNQREIDLIIDPEDLFNPLRYDAKKRAEIYIAELDKHKNDRNYIIDPDDLDEFEILLDEYNLMDKKIKGYESIAYIYFNKREYKKEYEYLLKAWELRTRYPNRKLNYRIMIKLGSNYINTGRYEDAIALYQKSLLNIDDILEKHLIYLYYNYALACSRLNMYSVALEVISTFFEHSKKDDYDLWNSVYVLEGLCYFKMEEYELSLNSYNKALMYTKFGYGDAKYIIYGNMIEIYTKLNDENGIYKYLNAILRNFNEFDKDSSNYSKICNRLARTYEGLGQLEESEHYYKESLEYSKKNIQEENVIKNLTSLMDLNNKAEVKDIFKIMEEYNNYTISELKVDHRLLLIFKSLKTYIDNKEYDQFERLIDILIINKEEE